MEDSKSDDSCKKKEVGKSGKRICCSCPDTRRVRDECMVLRGEEQCKQAIEAHKKCLRSEGFNI